MEYVKTKKFLELKWLATVSSFFKRFVISILGYNVLQIFKNLYVAVSEQT